MAAKPAKDDKPKAQRVRTFAFPYMDQERERLEKIQAQYSKELGIPVNLTDTFRIMLARTYGRLAVATPEEPK
jgi:hypothetical protein